MPPPKRTSPSPAALVLMPPVRHFRSRTRLARAGRSSTASFYAQAARSPQRGLAPAVHTPITLTPRDLIGGLALLFAGVAAAVMLYVGAPAVAGRFIPLTPETPMNEPLMRTLPPVPLPPPATVGMAVEQVDTPCPAARPGRLREQSRSARPIAARHQRTRAAPRQIAQVRRDRAAPDRAWRGRRVLPESQRSRSAGARWRGRRVDRQRSGRHPEACAACATRAAARGRACASTIAAT